MSKNFFSRKELGNPFQSLQDPILNEMNPVHVFTAHLFKCKFN
jgi:hypothetical protein